MPYQRFNCKVYTKKEGKWILKQTCGSILKASAAMRLLNGLEDGTIKPNQVGKGRYSKKKNGRRNKKSKR